MSSGHPANHAQPRLVRSLQVLGVSALPLHRGL